MEVKKITKRKRIKARATKAGSSELCFRKVRTNVTTVVENTVSHIHRKLLVEEGLLQRVKTYEIRLEDSLIS